MWGTAFPALTAWCPRLPRVSVASARVSAGAKSVLNAASAVAGAMIAARVMPTSRRRVAAAVARVPVQVRTAHATTAVSHVRQTGDRLPHAVAVVIFRARSAMTHSALRQLARRRPPHRRRTAPPAVLAVVVTRRLPSLDSRPVSVRRANRRCPLWPIKWPRARSRSRAAVPVMVGERARQSRPRAPRLRTIRLRAVVAVARASRAEVPTVPLEAPTTLRLPSR